MVKLITFSLFGDDPTYFDGALRNIELWPGVYPDWRVRIYVSDRLNPDWRERLDATDAEIVTMEQKASYDGLAWRFLPGREAEVEAFISRDIDAGLSLREKSAVDQWLASGKKFHVIRDHPQHRALILAGLWGARGGSLPDIAERIERFGRRRGFENRRWDQQFLARHIYPQTAGELHVNSAFIHYETEEPLDIPTQREGNDYLGCPVARGPLTDRRIRRFERMKDVGRTIRELPPFARPKG